MIIIARGSLGGRLGLLLLLLSSSSSIFSNALLRGSSSSDSPPTYLVQEDQEAAGLPPHHRRYLPMGADPFVPQATLPDQPTNGYLQVDLLADPKISYSGGSVSVSPDTRHMYYAEGDEGTLRTANIDKEGHIEKLDPTILHEVDASGAAVGPLGSRPVISVSDDGLNVYALRREGGVKGLAVMSRERDSGLLTIVQEVGARDGLADDAVAMALSVDGKYVYVGCGRPGMNDSLRIMTFDRDLSKDGRLHLLQTLPLLQADDVSSITSRVDRNISYESIAFLVRSPDSEALYVGTWEKDYMAQSLLTYSVNATTGKLKYRQGLHGYYSPAESWDFATFDFSGGYLYAGAASATSNHSWVLSHAWVFSRQPGDDLALFYDPFHNPPSHAQISTSSPATISKLSEVEVSEKDGEGAGESP